MNTSFGPNHQQVTELLATLLIMNEHHWQAVLDSIHATGTYQGTETAQEIHEINLVNAAIETEVTDEADMLTGNAVWRVVEHPARVLELNEEDALLIRIAATDAVRATLVRHAIPADLYDHMMAPIRHSELMGR